LLRFPAVYLAQQQHLAPLVDPRNGAPSDEYSRYVMASQQIWQVLPVCLNMYDSHPNSNQAENMTKFYTNYSIKAGGAYQWYHPTYVTDLMTNLCSPVMPARRKPLCAMGRAGAALKASPGLTSAA